MKHINIPVFIPHLGCPNNCVFCNQRTISGQSDFHEEDVLSIIEQTLSTVSDTDEAEIAFFGGSFTGIDRDLMIRLLDTAYRFVRSGKVKSVRCSTRPDYIDDDILDILSERGVKTIELGIQSMSDSVLSASRRGHTAAQTVEACKMIKSRGFRLGGQMMIGLPGADEASEIETAKAICELSADEARVYPTVVFRGTELADMCESGSYRALDYNEAAERTASVLDVFDSAGVPVIRVGLCSGEKLTSDADTLCGANHPAMGELAMSELFFRRISAQLDTELAKLKDELNNKNDKNDKNDKKLVIYVPRGATSRAIGQKRCNIIKLSEKYCTFIGKNRLTVLENDELFGYNIKIGIL